MTGHLFQHIGATTLLTKDITQIPIARDTLRPIVREKHIQSVWPQQRETKLIDLTNMIAASDILLREGSSVSTLVMSVSEVVTLIDATETTDANPSEADDTCVTEIVDVGCGPTTIWNLLQVIGCFVIPADEDRGDRSHLLTTVVEMKVLQSTIARRTGQMVEIGGSANRLKVSTAEQELRTKAMSSFAFGQRRVDGSQFAMSTALHCDHHAIVADCFDSCGLCGCCGHRRVRRRARRRG
mmetsp:Transcript_8333/g.25815  ORF Transcript_8333/g.25815 Transcript_8333/m.25815 type:complete len:240 (+) Transcript_8333:66-785(+)